LDSLRHIFRPESGGADPRRECPATALEDYGPETAGARAQIKQRVAKTIDQIWGRHESDKALVALNFAAAIDVLHNSDKSLDTFHPSTDDQKQALARPGKSPRPSVRRDCKWRLR
jgi:hypothetical protein